MAHSSRIKSIQEYLKEKNLDAFVVLTKINRQYLSGFTGSAGVLMITPRRAELYVDDRYLIRARKESDLSVKPINRLTTMTPSFSPPHDPFGGAQGHLERSRNGEGEVGRGSRRIGIEDRITLREFQELKKRHPRAKFKITHNLIENLRALKSAREIRNIKKGSRIIDEIFKRIVKLLSKNSPQLPSLIKEGKGEFREMDIALLIEKTAKKLGAEALAFDPIVASGANAAAPHHFSSNQKIRRNNFLLLDFGVIVNGYHSDFTRTLFIGKPNKKQEKVYNIVLEAQLRAINAMTPLTSPLTISTPLKVTLSTAEWVTRGERGGSGEGERGVKGKDIDDVARRFIGQRGFGSKFTHNTGHGVGLEIHELPNFSPDSEDILKNHMVVTVEPGIYIEGWGGARIEDMVVIGKKPEVLSKIPKDFNAMIIK